MQDPVAFADRLGAEYLAQVDAAVRKARGQFFTPPEAARFMAGLALWPDNRPVRLLDPGAGSGILASAAVARLVELGAKSIHIEAYEIDPDLADVVRRVLAHAAESARERGAAVSFEVFMRDFALSPHAGLDGLRSTYDLVIANPPYFKLNREDPRASAAGFDFKGQPNIYAVFMALAAQRLRTGGQLVFITPRSFAAGPYFTEFRKRFFALIRPTRLHLFHSRGKAFGRDEVLQENVILSGVKGKPDPNVTVEVSVSDGIHDLDNCPTRRLPIGLVLHGQDAIVRLPLTLEDDQVLEAVDTWTDRLETHGWRASTGPIVAFRTPEVSDEGGAQHAPLLWLQNVRAMAATWPLERKAQHVRISASVKPYLVPDQNMVLLRRFSAKEEERRIVAAPYFKGDLPSSLVGLENHLNYIVGDAAPMSREEAAGLAILLNSPLLDSYFRISNGNTQVSATELRALPLPPKTLIRELGGKVLAAEKTGPQAFEAVINQVLPSVAVHG